MHPGRATPRWRTSWPFLTRGLRDCQAEQDRTGVRYSDGMGYQNPPITWRELNHRLGDWDPKPPAPWADGGDASAWSRQRGPDAPPPLTRGTSTVPYAELHCHTNFSFLDGASHPQE